MHNLREQTFWGQRYAREGAMWGDGPSATAQRLNACLPARGRILEVGFGYGRDLRYLAAQGHEMTGIEDPGVCAASQLQFPNVSISTMGLSAFSRKTSMFDAMLAHRVWHLLDHQDRLCFIDLAVKGLVPGGWLAISYRDERGFVPEQMKWMDDRRAAYRFRPNHVIEFWDRKSIRACFKSDFENFSFLETEEIESSSNPIACPITIVLASRKTCRRWTVELDGAAECSENGGERMTDLHGGQIGVVAPAISRCSCKKSLDLQRLQAFPNGLPTTAKTSAQIVLSELNVATLVSMKTQSNKHLKFAGARL